MSETAAAEAATAPAQEPTSTPANDQPTTPKADTDWVAEARKWEARAKENAAKAKANEQAAARLAELEEAQKTEAQKLADRLAAAEKKALEAERRAFAKDKGVPVSLVTGTTPEEWEAAAAEALAWKDEGIKPPSSAAPAAGVQGNVGKAIGNGAPQDIDAEIQAAQAAGDWRAAMSLTNSKLANQAGKD